MQHDSADDLYREVAHPQNAVRSFAADRKGVRQNVVKGFAVGKAFL